MVVVVEERVVRKAAFFTFGPFIHALPLLMTALAAIVAHVFLLEQSSPLPAVVLFIANRQTV